MPNETATLVLSGKILDAPFPLTSLDAIRTAVERETSARGVAVVRRVATLAPSRFSAAPEFLKAGFEVVPADDEDVQATALLFSALATTPPSTELLFALGVSEPFELLRALAGRTRRVLLTTADVSPALDANLEGLYDLRALLADDGIDLDALDRASWNALGDATGDAPPPPTDAPDASAPADDLCELGPEVGPDAVELDAPAWNAALERLLLEGDLVSSAYVATEKISDRFPELPCFFLTRREDFRRLLSPQILMVEEDSATKLYHKTHPDYRPLASTDALASLNLGAVSSDERNALSETGDAPAAKRRIVEDAQDFPELVARVRAIAEDCRRLADGFPAPQDDDPATRFKSAFPRSFARRLASDELEEAAQCYDVAAKAFDLFERVVETPRHEIDDRLFARVAQTTANAQCGLKSVLLRLDVPLAADGAQRAAYELLLKSCGPRGVFLANLRFHDRLSREETLALADVVDELAQEIDEFQARLKERRSLEGKVEYHLKKIADGSGSAYDWDKIVEATTTLCETFRKPPSSLWFRERLLDFVDKIPDETQTTDAFGRVVQEIDLYRMREDETTAALFDMPEVGYSPAVQAVRERYAGARAVFVGGTPQPHLQARLEKNLNVRLLWSETSHGDSLERFAGLLRDEETRLFLIYIPWCSHKHSEEFAALIKDANKDCVRLRKGTNPEQIALAICRQFRLLPESQL
ncbi:MAG: hypothetical protein IJ991_19155 [Thermoguttaceae bacterium]|nr:hypothetical protein [Thermoguttaceae bacterium]